MTATLFIEINLDPKIFSYFESHSITLTPSSKYSHFIGNSTIDSGFICSSPIGVNRSSGKIPVWASPMDVIIWDIRKIMLLSESLSISDLRFSIFLFHSFSEVYLNIFGCSFFRFVSRVFISSNHSSLFNFLSSFFDRLHPDKRLVVSEKIIINNIFFSKYSP